MWLRIDIGTVVMSTACNLGINMPDVEMGQLFSF